MASAATCSSDGEEALEELAIALQGDTQILRGDLLASIPLLLELRAGLRRTLPSACRRHRLPSRPPSARSRADRRRRPTAPRSSASAAPKARRRRRASGRPIQPTLSNRRSPAGTRDPLSDHRFRRVRCYERDLSRRARPLSRWVRPLRRGPPAYPPGAAPASAPRAQRDRRALSRPGFRVASHAWSWACLLGSPFWLSVSIPDSDPSSRSKSAR